MGGQSWLKLSSTKRWKIDIVNHVRANPVMAACEGLMEEAVQTDHADRSSPCGSSAIWRGRWNLAGRRAHRRGTGSGL